MTKTNQPCFRNDAISKVTGKAKYADDLKFHNMLYAVPVYTDSVHAKINNIDITAATNAPGVVKIITAKDIPGHIAWGQIYQDYYILAQDKVRFHGDVVAIVVAESRQHALAASEKIQIDLTELPPILDSKLAMQKKSPLVHEAKGSNIINHHKIRRGNPERVWQKTAHIIEQDFTTQFVEHAYLEPESAVAIPRADGVIEVHAGIQHPFTARRFTAAILGVPLTEVEFVGTPLGGGFGGRDDTASIISARTALAAKLTGHPVKMTYTREWSIRESYKRHPYQAHYKMGITADGEILAVQCEIIADGGAYTSVTPWVTWRSTVQCCGPYKVPNVHCDVYGVHTNNVFTGAFRGFGSPQVNFMIEQLVEIAAKKVNLTALEFRELNMLRQGDITITGQKLDGHTVSLNTVMHKTLATINYAKKIKNCNYGQSNTDELYGIGFAISYRGMSLGAEGIDFCSAIINGQFDGSILLEVGIHENGQGTESAMILLLAEHLGINKNRIRYRRPSTSNIPDGGPSVASRCTLMGGGAVVNAANILKQQIANLLADQLNCKPIEVIFENDRLYSKNHKKYLTWDEAMQQMFKKQAYPYAFGVFQAPKVSWIEDTGHGNAYFTWVYGCDAVELSVNKKTGKIKILNYVASHDVGKAINPPMLLGQYYGGITQGIGYALFESLNTQNGKILNNNLHTYRIPKATDIPEITGIIIENPDPHSPSYAKGVGEPALELVAPAIANAIYNATGVRHFSLPITIKRENPTNATND
jgi:CO/xanthine dehydrogenase Mo-binding subunit